MQLRHPAVRCHHSDGSCVVGSTRSHISVGHLWKHVETHFCFLCFISTKVPSVKAKSISFVLLHPCVRGQQDCAAVEPPGDDSMGQMVLGGTDRPLGSVRTSSAALGNSPKNKSGGKTPPLGTRKPKVRCWGLGKCLLPSMDRDGDGHCHRATGSCQQDVHPSSFCHLCFSLSKYKECVAM